MLMNRHYVLSIPLVLAFAASHPAEAQEVQRVDVREGGVAIPMRLPRAISLGRAIRC
jgi:hypothetical protein